MSAATATTVQNPSPLRRKTFYLCVLCRSSRFCPRTKQPQNTHSENKANLRCSGLNTDFVKCRAFRDYPRIERRITRHRAKHPQSPSAQPTHQNLTQTGLQRTSSKIARKFNKRNMAEREGFEPSVRYNPYDDLANRWFQPLTHRSAWRKIL